MKKVLDIWAIQSIKEELPIALNNIQTNDAIVFENASIELTIGDKVITDKIFDTAIYSEKSDVLVLIMKHSPVTSKEAKDYLEYNGIKYHLVSFLEEESIKPKLKTPEIWFARDSHVVAEALENSLINKVSKYYFFDKDIDSCLEFKFLNSSENFKSTFDGRILFTGLITLDDKIILITKAIHNPDKKLAAIEKVLEKKGFIENFNKSL